MPIRFHDLPLNLAQKSRVRAALRLQLALCKPRANQRGDPWPPAWKTTFGDGLAKPSELDHSRIKLSPKRSQRLVIILVDTRRKCWVKLPEIKRMPIVQLQKLPGEEYEDASGLEWVELGEFQLRSDVYSYTEFVLAWSFCMASRR